MEDKRDFASGATSTKQIRLSLVPHGGLVNIARIFEKGIVTHEDKAYNALSKNQGVLEDRDFLIERASHAIEHAYRIIDNLKAGINICHCADDAGAVGWFGVMMGEASVRDSGVQAGFYVPTDLDIPLNKPAKFQTGQEVFYGMVPHTVIDTKWDRVTGYSYTIRNERVPRLDVYEFQLHGQH